MKFMYVLAYLMLTVMNWRVLLCLKEGLESESILGDDEDHTHSILLSLEEWVNVTEYVWMIMWHVMWLRLVYSTQEADPGAENSEDDVSLLAIIEPESEEVRHEYLD